MPAASSASDLSADRLAMVPITLTGVAETLDLYILDRLSGGEMFVPCLHGQPSTGKTSAIRATGARHGMAVVEGRASEWNPEDIGGVPLPQRFEVGGLTDPMETLFREHTSFGYSEHFGPAHLVRLTAPYEEFRRVNWERLRAQGIPGIEGAYEPPLPTLLSLDEFTNARSKTMASLQTFILDRTLGASNLRLRNDVVVVCAGNYEEDSDAVESLPWPLRTRMMHLHVMPTTDEWLAWARANGIHPVVIAFIRRRPAALYDYDPQRSAHTYACYRTWVGVSHLLRAREKFGHGTQFLAQQICGLVDSKFGSEFVGYLTQTFDMPTPEAVVADPQGAPVHARVDVQLAMVESLILAVAHHPDWTDPVLDYVARLHEAAIEVAAPRLLGLDSETNVEVIRKAMQNRTHAPMLRRHARRVTDISATGRGCLTPASS